LTQIYVDADACPVKQEVYRVAERHNLIVHIVSNSGMIVPRHPLFRQVVVPEGPDAADDWIAERITPADIAITQDILLAGRCVEIGARALSPAGKLFDAQSIGMAVAMRNLMQDLRESGDIEGRNPAFTKKDRSNFLNALEQNLRAIKAGK
jgi:uncharacterized protein YaiI (UPF0178 family)